MRIHLLLPRLAALLSAIVIHCTARAADLPLPVGDDCQYTSIQKAIDNVHGDFDYIKIKKGFRSGHITIPSNVHYLMIVGGFANCDDATPDPDLGNDPTIIDGSIGDAGHSAISVSGSTTLLYLENLVVTGGNRPFNGGGIYMSAGDCSTQDCGLQLKNLRVNSNTAANAGGAIYLYGSPNSPNTVLLQIDGAQIALNDAPYGGGIDVEGKVAVDISNTALLSNTAHYGGGMNVDLSAQTPNAADVVLHFNTLLQGNQATTNDGGGMRIAGVTRLLADEDQISFYLNTAASWGGGLQVEGPASASIGSAGYRPAGGGPVFYGNHAHDGGAIMIHGNDSKDAYVRVYSANSQFATEFKDNQALVDGGAIYLKPTFNDSGHPGHAGLRARDFTFATNVAADGAAVFADRDTTGLGGTSIGTTVELLPSTRCPDNPACNLAVANYVGTFDGNGGFNRTGGALFTSIDSDITLYAARVQGNLVGRIFSALDNDSHLIVHDDLIAGNDVMIDVARIENDSAMEIDSCTIADNTIGTDHVFSAGGSQAARLNYSIVSQPGTNTYSGDPSKFSAQYDFLDERLSFGGDITNNLSDPQFVDRANGNYHLRWTSPAVDYAPYRNDDIDNGVDLDGSARTRNLSRGPGDPNTRDIGAFELQSRPTDIIFANGFDG